MDSGTLTSTKLLLSDWGRHMRGGMPRGLPKSAAFVHANSGARGDDVPDVPEHVAEVDQIICRAPYEHRVVLWMDYVRGVDLWLEEKAARVGLTRWSYRRAVLAAQVYVDKELEKNLHGAARRV